MQEVKTVPRCPICGKEYQEIDLGPRINLLKIIGEKIRFAPVCGCLMKEREEEKMKDRQRLLEESEKSLMMRLFADSQLTRRSRTCTFSNFFPRDERNQNALTIAKEFTQRFTIENQEQPNGLLFYGPIRRGKTHLAAAIGVALLQRGHSIVFQKMCRLVWQLRDKARGEGSQVDIIEPLLHCELLILDDLGVEEEKEWLHFFLYSVFDDRLENLNPVVITSKYFPEELKKRLGEHIFSRIEQMCRFVEV